MTKRILFLDDDPRRAEAFAADRPEAVWVQTVEDCLTQLEERWDEVHLDHDLGGEAFVDPDRDDCGMAVVRWLAEEPRAHLQDAQFYIHTHNPNAACVMALHLEVIGYRVAVLPFGRWHEGPAPGLRGRRRSDSLIRRILRWLGG